jgi:hypothetical protein
VKSRYLITKKQQRLEAITLIYKLRAIILESLNGTICPEINNRSENPS